MCELIIAMGIPSAVTGILVWWFKRYVEKMEREREEHERKTEEFMLMIIQSSRATNLLAEATAKALQNMPEAHCNGEMTAALEQAAKFHKEEKEWLFKQGIENIFN